ncbi:Cell division protein FtsA [Streptococcus parauberis]|uniref:Cell division protein FtsA n=1 Tax=Streptococcus parauberis KRS-02083 TaxID=1207545 RepID=A0ABN0IRF3_9STRE|nr:cell division protein FtsA [Streptococcus parauberis]AUT06529.1 Cell division protein FtsA [Streptococcus parauberis]EMG25461.1 Cell division protein [Streptococcus parauberis KRS-02083]UWV09909.1 cell division protein FtsA [Streptococcus parauberis]WEM64595.1 cell division protein FtsA [Streptococcus parauberis]WOF46430.1 cell division protein FtsA [Streptococcus parauberis]
MARNGFFTGLDIGTSSIKVLVAEFISGEMNVIGVSNIPSTGVKDGIIIDIEAAAAAIKTAVEQAEEKAGMTIDKINVGLPANLLQIEPSQGMIPVPSESKEIKDEDVDSVVKSALTKSITPEREVISLVPEEFIVDGFQGIRDPRGMMGIRLEMRGLIYTGPSTILHNLRKTVERAGISVENIIITPLAMARTVLNEGEREFGATVIDMGGGQTTVATMRAQELQYTNIYTEGGDYITKDISKVLKTSMSIAEALKFNFGQANINEASETETVKVDVVGSEEPVEVTERYLSEIVSARVRHILDRVKQDLERGRLLDLPGGIVLVGGGAIMPGLVDVAQEILGTNVKLHVPNQVGIRNPMFANVISLVEFVGKMSEVDVLAQNAVSGEEMLRRKPIDFAGRDNYVPNFNESRPSTQTSNYNQQPVAPVDYNSQEPTQPKQKLGDRVRGIFGSMFD